MNAKTKTHPDVIPQVPLLARVVERLDDAVAAGVHGADAAVEIYWGKRGILISNVIGWVSCVLYLGLGRSLAPFRRLAPSPHN